MVTKRARTLHRRLDDELVVADDHMAHTIEDRISRLRSLENLTPGPGTEPLTHGERCVCQEASHPQDVEGFLEGRWIGRRGTRRDHIKRVADDVGQHEGHHEGGRGRPRQLATLEAREMLAHGVELANGGAGREQRAGHGLLLGKGDVRRWRRCQG